MKSKVKKRNRMSVLGHRRYTYQTILNKLTSINSDYVNIPHSVQRGTNPSPFIIFPFKKSSIPQHCVTFAGNFPISIGQLQTCNFSKIGEKYL